MSNYMRRLTFLYNLNGSKEMSCIDCCMLYVASASLRKLLAFILMSLKGKFLPKQFLSQKEKLEHMLTLWAFSQVKNPWLPRFPFRNFCQYLAKNFLMPGLCFLMTDFYHSSTKINHCEKKWNTLDQLKMICMSN